MADDFDAFISYSRTDRAFAEKLSETLQGFTPPADLAVPQRPPRIFRDVSDLAGNEYFSSIDSQVRHSRKLILLCSPAARQSTFVDDEIRRFLEAQGARHIIPVLVDGIPNNEAQAGQDALMAFPHALCEALSMPLAVGYRQWDPDSDPIDAGRFKDSWYTLLAGLYDVSRAEIEARDSARRARERAAWSRRLATTSIRALEVEPELAVLLAANAVTITKDPDGVVVPEAEEALHKTIEYFQRRRTVPLLALHGHEGPLWDVQYSPDGTALVTASEDCSWRLWDAVTGRQLASVTGTPMHGPVKGAKFSPDGLCLVTAHLDSRAKHWTQTSARSIYLNAHCWQVAYSPNGKAVATAGLDGEINVWDLETGEALLKFEFPGPAVAVAFSRDGNRVAGGGRDGIAKIWDFEGETELEGHRGTVMAVAFGLDDQYVATACDDSIWRLFNAKTGVQVAAVPAPGADSARPGEKSLAAIAFDPSGTRVATACRDKTATVWDTRTRREILTLAGHTGGVWGVAFHPRADRLATASYDGTARVWDVSPHKELLTRLSQADDVSALAFHANGAVLYSGGYHGTVCCWSVEQGALTGTFETGQGTVSGIACHATQDLVATADGNGTVSLWTGTGQHVRTLTGHSKSAMSVAFSPDGKRLLSAGLDGKAIVWDFETGEPVAHLVSGSNELAAAIFSPDGETIATAPTAHEWAAPAGENTIARLWKTVTHERILELKGHRAQLAAMAYSPDGESLVTASADHTARVWDTGTGRQVAALSGHLSRVQAVAFSPDGSRIATGSIDRAVKLWTIAAPKDPVTLPGHSDQVVSLAFSPDGRYIASGARNGAILLHCVSVDTLIAAIQAAVPRRLTDEEAAEHLPGSGLA